MGDRIKRLAPHVGFRHADRWREIVWDDVHALQRAQVVLEPRLHDLAGRPEGHRPRPGVELLYTDLIRLPVRDPSGRRIGVVDVRTTLPDPEPAVLGLLVAAHPLRRTLGLKRFDSTSQRFGGTRHHTRYLAWTEDIQIKRRRDPLPGPVHRSAVALRGPILGSATDARSTGRAVRRVFIAALLVMTVAGCTAPGEPPAHPATADYHDLMRRETGKATSTIATMQVVVGELRRGRITQNYATVMTRQSVADLTSIVTDLRQITAPSADLVRHQRQLQRLLAEPSRPSDPSSATGIKPARLARTAIRLAAAGHDLARLTPCSPEARQAASSSTWSSSPSTATSASTTAGSKWEPALRRSSAVASCAVRAGEYGRSAVIVA